MSPIMWDLGHIAHFEELWLVRNLDGPVEFGEMPGIYNPFEHPRRVRGELSCRRSTNAARSWRRSAQRVLAAYVECVDLESDDDPLLRDGYVYSMVLQHEYQHNETILQTLQLKQGTPYRAPRAFRCRRDGASARPRRRWCVSAAGAFVSGPTTVRAPTTTSARARGRRRAVLRSTCSPVTNGEFLEFMRDGGYRAAISGRDAGWQWLAEAAVDAPKYWLRDGDDWCARVMDHVASVDPDAPGCHVCYHEAEAFARFAGKRLPTEAEWEVAAAWDPATRQSCALSVGRRARDAGAREHRSAVIRDRTGRRVSDSTCRRSAATG